MFYNFMNALLKLGWIMYGVFINGGNYFNNHGSDLIRKVLLLIPFSQMGHFL